MYRGNCRGVRIIRTKNANNLCELSSMCELSRDHIIRAHELTIRRYEGCLEQLVTLVVHGSCMIHGLEKCRLSTENLFKPFWW